MAKITFCGGAGMVTGSCYLIEAGKTKILVDCGMVQGSRFAESLNADPFPFDAKEISAVVVSHAHIDHTGRLPKLYKEGFRGKVYGTGPTLDFTHVLLLDSEHVIRSEAEREGMQPIYNLKDVEMLFTLIAYTPYGEAVAISEDISFKLHDAGHILGSSIIEIFLKNEKGEPRKIVFSGDLGNSPTPLLRDTYTEKESDYLVIESTYGDRVHETREARKDLLEDIIEETIRNGGVLMIPVFSTERTQELLFEFNELVEHGRVPTVPVFVDSPLAIKITEIFKKYPDFYNHEAARLQRSGDDLFNFPGLKFTPTIEDSKSINAVRPPKIIMAGSGMSHGGRIMYHEKLYLSDPRNTLLIIGYQVKGSLGRRLLDGEKMVKIMGVEIPVRAKVKRISGYSAHADQASLIDWVDPMRLSLRKVFVTHGEEDVSAVFAQILRDKYALETVPVKLGESFELE